MKKGKWRRVETEGGMEGGTSPPPKPEVSSPLPVAFTQPCTIAQFTITSISDLEGEEGKR